MGQLGGQRAGHVAPTTGTTPSRPAAEAPFVAGELQHVTAEATTVGLPSLRAKTNIELRGVGRKFNGLYHIEAVRHRIDSGGYSCELTLRRNALGPGAGRTATATRGTANVQQAPTAASRSAATPARPPARRQVVIDADSGQRR